MLSYKKSVTEWAAELLLMHSLLCFRLGKEVILCQNPEDREKNAFNKNVKE